MAETTAKPDLQINEQYAEKYGFSDVEDYVFKGHRGLSREVVEEISRIKGEPAWMLERRLQALAIYYQKPLPTWGGDLTTLDFENIFYYIKPATRQGDTWEDVPPYIKKTFDRLGIPEAEQKFLAGVGAQYECLSGDARVYTARGPVPIRDVQPGDTVFALNEQSGCLMPASVRATDAKGEREVFEVRVGTRSIKATANHPFLALEYERAPGKQRGRYHRTWKYLRDLKPGDLVAVAKQIPDAGQAHALARPVIKTRTTLRNQFGVTAHEYDFSHMYTPVSLPEHTSDDLMWWLGLYVGDGFIHNGKTGEAKARVELAIPETDAPLRQELGRVTQKLFGLPAKNGDPYRMTVGSTLIARYLESNGLGGTAHTKRVPEWVFGLPRAQKLAFLGGYVDADGYVRDAAKNHAVVLTSGNESLLQDMKALCAMCGLPTSSVHRFESKHPHDEGRTIVGYRMEVAGDFDCIRSRSPQRTERMGKRKFHHDYSSAGNTTFRSHVNEFFGFAQIEAIIPAGVEQVYDIEVDGPHNFVAEGLIVHNSEVVYHKIKQDLSDQGVLFLDTDSALRDHPEIFREYFGTIIPSADNKFAALNTAVWSGGSFIYVPKGVRIEMPLQAYFRINAQNMGQFERTLIIVDEGAYVHYVEGCTAPIYSSDSLHSAVVEIIVKKGARCRYTTIQNWSNNVYNLVTKRAVAYENATMEWVDGNLGCLAEGSTVTTATGVKPIEALEVGERVLSLDEATGELCFRRVMAKKFSGYQHVREIAYGERRIRVTDNHPFYSYVYDRAESNGHQRHRLGYVRADLVREVIVPSASSREVDMEPALAAAGYATSQASLAPHRNVGRSNIDLPEALEVVKVSVGEPSPEPVPTWDIEVEGTGNFVAEGFIVHNSKLTMKYPSVYLMGAGAKGEVLSIAMAGPGQHQDAGGKVVHGAPHTTSRIISKSISKGGGRATYRGLLKVHKGAAGSKSNVVCDALLLDPQSRSDTYPVIEIDEDDVTIGHEATVSKVSDEQLFYLMSRGMSQDEAASMIVQGFIEPLAKELPMEYSIELNRLIQLQMEGSVG